MLERTKRIAEKAPRYASLEDFIFDVTLSREVGYGWFEGRLYELYPGGRCIRLLTACCKCDTKPKMWFMTNPKICVLCGLPEVELE